MFYSVEEFSKLPLNKQISLLSKPEIKKCIRAEQLLEAVASPKKLVDIYASESVRTGVIMAAFSEAINIGDQKNILEALAQATPKMQKKFMTIVSNRLDNAKKEDLKALAALISVINTIDHLNEERGIVIYSELDERLNKAEKIYTSRVAKEAAGQKGKEKTTEELVEIIINAVHQEEVSTLENVPELVIELWKRKYDFKKPLRMKLAKEIIPLKMKRTEGGVSLKSYIDMAYFYSRRGNQSDREVLSNAEGRLDMYIRQYGDNNFIPGVVNAKKHYEAVKDRQEKSDKLSSILMKINSLVNPEQHNQTRVGEDKVLGKELPPKEAMKVLRDYIKRYERIKKNEQKKATPVSKKRQTKARPAKTIQNKGGKRLIAMEK